VVAEAEAEIVISGLNHGVWTTTRFSVSCHGNRESFCPERR
jgi:hypothetical protein